MDESMIICELQEYDRILRKIEKANLPNAVITDIGKTEFGGVPTVTAMAIGPADSDEINKITGHLKLL